MKTIFLITFFLAFNSVFSQEIYNGKKVKSVASFQFKNASYYDYQINARHSDSIYHEVLNTNTPEGLLSQKHSDFLSENSSEEEKGIILYSRLTIEYNDFGYYFIRYALKDNNIQPKIALFKKEKNNYVWLEKPDNKISESVSIILKLSNAAFSEFETEEDDKDFSEINRLKSLTKDADGTLNLFKLAEIIEKNKGSLLKYLIKRTFA